VLRFGSINPGGGGKSSSYDPPDPFTIADWAQYLAEFLDLVGIATRLPAYSVPGNSEGEGAKREPGFLASALS